MGSPAHTPQKQPAPHRSPRTTGSTKDAILDSAEVLFADNDVAAVTMRSIADAAGVDPASVTYHFGSKPDLIAAVIRRRYGELREHRTSALARLLSEAREIPTAHQLLDTVYRPLFDMIKLNDHGWRSYSNLVASTLSSGVIDDLAQDQAGHWEETLFAALCRAYPEAERATILQGLMLTIGAALSLSAPPVNAEDASPSDPADPDLDYRRFLRFVAAGFESMVTD